jgi:hypothetical protein
MIPPREEWPTLQDILQSHNEVDAKYTLTPRLWEYLQDYRAKHEKAGNGFGQPVWPRRCRPHPVCPLSQGRFGNPDRPGSYAPAPPDTAGMCPPDGF